MNVIRYNPSGFVGRFSRDADRFFAHHLLPATAEEAVTHNDWVPAIAVSEEENRYLIRADVPGVEIEDLDVIRRSERVSGRFYRRCNLPESVDSTGISADYRQGVLEISIPKQAEAQPQRIEIKVN